MGLIWLKYVVWGVVQLGLATQISLPPLAYYLLLEGAIANLVIGFLMLLRAQFPTSLRILGKDRITGHIPWWSYVIFWSFHFINHLVVYIKAWPACTDVLGDGRFYLGGYNSRFLKKHYSGVVDLTCEFPAAMSCDNYLNVRVWDGTPPSTADIKKAIEFCESHAEKGPLLIHCAYGRGRSTTLMIAYLVHIGTFPSIQEAHDAIKKVRPEISVNVMMRGALEKWHSER